MEFHEKLQALRKQKGLTQEELAGAIYVSRTAVSKWESGRGYPSIDSLKALSAFFGVTIDQLLSGEELLTAAGEDARQARTRFRGLVFGLLDVSVAMLCFLPFFGQEGDGRILAVSLPALTGVSPWLRSLYWALTAGTVLRGGAALVLPDRQPESRTLAGNRFSLLLTMASALLFTAGRQPYAAALALLFSAIKATLLAKNP